MNTEANVRVCSFLSGMITPLIFKSQRVMLEIRCKISWISSSVLYGRSLGLKELREETISRSSIKWVDLGYEWTVKDVSIPEEVLSEIVTSEREEGMFSEVHEWGCASWRNNAEIELDVDHVDEEDHVCTALDLSLYDCVTGQKKVGWQIFRRSFRFTDQNIINKKGRI